MAAFAAAVIAMTALGAAGVAFAWYPTTVLVIPGLAWTALMATRGDWRRLAIGPALVLIGIAGAAAGPAGSWAVAAVGLCAMLLGMAAATAWHQHA